MEEVVKRPEAISYFLNCSWQHERNSNYETYLHLASRLNRPDLVIFMVQNSDLIDVPDSKGNTCLHIASELGHTEIISTLLKNGASSHNQNLSGDYPIHLSSCTSFSSVLDTFLSFNINLNLQNRNGETILHMAVDLNSTPSIEKLLNSSINLNLQDNEGWTALHLACRLNNLQAIQLLLQSGADYTLMNSRGDSALSVCLRYGNLESLQLLLQNSVTISQNDVKVSRETSKPSIWQDLMQKFKKQQELDPISNENLVITEQSSSSTLSFPSIPTNLSQDSVLSDFSSQIFTQTCKNHSISEEFKGIIGKIPEVDKNDLKIEGVVGRGLSGEVFKAEWRNCLVAVKRFYDKDEFLAELEVLATIRHPNVVMIMAANLNEKMIVQEFMGFGSLNQLLQSGVELSRGQKIEMALDVVEGLVFLHSSVPPVVHRDLKSANCLVDRRFQVKIADFGLARIRANSFRDTQTLGTAAYMAPEVIMNQKYSTKSDIYSFGILLYEILYQSNPYPDMACIQIMYQVAHQVNYI